MNAKKQQEIIRTWKELEQDDPDASTERLLEMVGHKCLVDIDAVIAAMVSDGYWKE